MAPVAGQLSQHSVAWSPAGCGTGLGRLCLVLTSLRSSDSSFSTAARDVAGLCGVWVSSDVCKALV